MKEVASGVNDTQPKLTALLKEDSWGTLVVGNKDRRSRVGFGWFDVLLGLQVRRNVVADAAAEEKADLLDDFVSIIYGFAAHLYGLRSAAAQDRSDRRSRVGPCCPGTVGEGLRR